MGAELSKALYQHGECGSTEVQVAEIHDESDHSEGEYNSPCSGPTCRGQPANTVIIFDWDDTLLCSSAINSQQWSAKQLQELERAAESVLHTAMSLGETLIVTNGNGSWVQDSAKRFLPRLLPTLAQLTVVSARALYEHIYPGDPYMWKRAAFRKLLLEERQVPTDPGLNLVALGDQHPEIEAAHNVGRAIGGSSLVKTIKFKEAPSVPELLGQLSRAERELCKIVHDESSWSRGLVRRQLPPHLEHLASRASGWRCSGKDEASWGGLPKTLGLKDLWPLFT